MGKFSRLPSHKCSGSEYFSLQKSGGGTFWTYPITSNTPILKELSLHMKYTVAIHSLSYGTCHNLTHSKDFCIKVHLHFFNLQNLITIINGDKIWFMNVLEWICFITV